MDMKKIKQLIINSIKDDIDKIKEEEKKLEEYFESEKNANIQNEISLFKELIQSINHSPSESEENILKKISLIDNLCSQTESEENILKKISLIDNLCSQIDVISEKLSLVANPNLLGGMGKINSIFNSIKSWLKSVSAHLWQLIACIVTPKEWSIQGGLNTPHYIYGLNGNVQLRITFGK